MRIPSVRSFAVLLVAAAGCAPDTTPPDRFLARDSSGVRIVEHVSIEGLPVRRTDENAALRIGGAADGDAAQVLDGVLAGAVLSDGRVAILDGGSAQLRLYDAAGAPLATQGRRGDGPEEYSNPTTMIPVAGDSMVVWDMAHGRATVVGPTGAVARTVTTPAELRSPLLAAVFGDGKLLVVNRLVDFKPGSSVQTEMGQDIRVSATGTPETVLGIHPFRTLQLMSDGVPVTQLGPQNQVEIRAVPFAPQTQRASRPDGYWLGRQRSFELAFIGADGGLKQLVRWVGGPLGVADADKQTYVDAAVEVAETEDAKTAIRGQGTAFFEFPPIFPTHGPLVGGADGSIWMNDFRRPGATGPEGWTVFDVDGVAKERVELPAGSTLLWAAPDRVLLLLKDDLDVERVELRTVGAAAAAVPTP